MRTIVVGASSGLGRCIAVDRGRRGDQVALLARRLDRLRAAAAETGPNSLAVACDVTDEVSVKEAIKEAVEGLGGLDRVIYATGIGVLGAIGDLTADSWKLSFETNVVGAALVTAQALPHLLRSLGSASYLSSISASLTPPWPGIAAYNVSKAALDKLIEALRAEYPKVGFTRIIVGDTGGGEGDGQTEFADSWDMETVGKFYPVWAQRGYVAGTVMEIGELLRTVDFVVNSDVSIPSVTVTPRHVNGPLEEISPEVAAQAAGERPALGTSTF